MTALTAKTLLVVMLAGTLATPSLYARMGETASECDTRYNRHGGNSKEVATTDFYHDQLISGPNTETYLFSYEGWLITIGFRDQRAARLKYQHENEKAKFRATHSPKITDDEIKAILGANANRNPWYEVPAEQLKVPTGTVKVLKEATHCIRLWTRADGAIAYRDNNYLNTLYIEDPIYVKQTYFPPKPIEKPKPPPAF